jgi:hypothetical protein
LKQTVCHNPRNHNSIRDCDRIFVPVAHPAKPRFIEPKECEDCLAFRDRRDPVGTAPYGTKKSRVLGMIFARFWMEDCFKKGGRHGKF